MRLDRLGGQVARRARGAAAHLLLRGGLAAREPLEGVGLLALLRALVLRAVVGLQVVENGRLWARVTAASRLLRATWAAPWLLWRVESSQKPEEASLEAVVASCAAAKTGFLSVLGCLHASESVRLRPSMTVPGCAGLKTLRT